MNQQMQICTTLLGRQVETYGLESKSVSKIVAVWIDRGELWTLLENPEGVTFKLNASGLRLKVEEK